MKTGEHEVVASIFTPVLYVLTTAAVLCVSSVQGMPCYWTVDGKMREEEYLVCAITVDYTPETCVRHNGYFELWGSFSGNPGQCSIEATNKAFRITCYCDTSAYCGGTPAPFERFIAEQEDHAFYYKCLIDDLRKGTFLPPDVRANQPTPTTEEQITQADDAAHARMKPPSKPYLSAEAKKYLHWAIGRNLIFFVVIAILIGVSGYSYYGKDSPDLGTLTKKKNSKGK